MDFEETCENNLIYNEGQYMVCDICQYGTYHNGDFNKHLLTKKHQKNLFKMKHNPYDLLQKHDCVCGKKYKYISGLSRHRKICEQYKQFYDEYGETDLNCNVGPIVIKQILDMQSRQISQNQIQIDQTQLLIDRIDKQDELIERTLQERPSITNNINNVQNNFCLNIFLNETCQNAIDFDDFVDSIEVSLEDIEQMERLDYASGISRLIVDRLQRASVVGRPLHCTDSKRDVLYIRIKANWQKADDNLKTRFIQAIKKIAHKNMMAINLWTRQNPEWNDPRSKMNDKYLKIVSNSMSGGTELEQKNNISKIISKVAKKVTIKKNKYQVK